MTTTDEALVARAVTLGDDAAFEELVRRHEGRIYHLLRRLARNDHLAEDLAQETFVRAWRKLASFRGSGSFAAWLSRLAYRVFLQHRRRNARRDDVASLDDPAMADAGAPAPDATEPDAGDLDRLLAVVSEDERALLVLSYGAGLSASEISDIVGSTSGTVKSQIHRAKAKIRRAFHIEAVS